MECMLHKYECHEPVTKFTTVSWEKTRVCAMQWLKLDGIGREIAKKYDALFRKSELSPENIQFGYHRRCYAAFTNKTDLSRAFLRCSNQKCEDIHTSSSSDKDTDDDAADNQQPEMRLLRSNTLSHSSSADRAFVLPKLCIICNKKNHYFRKGGKVVLDKLTTAQTIHAGKLREAAEQKKDENVLIHIRERDCVALEVSYHSDCYINYTKAAYKAGGQNISQYSRLKFTESFTVLCNTIIDRDIIQNHHTMRMDQILLQFRHLVKIHENGDASSYRSHRLKERLVERYPQLCFYQPNQRNKSEVVFVQNIYPGAIIERLPASSSSSETDLTAGETTPDVGDTPVKTSTTDMCGYVETNLNVMYTAAMMLRKELQSSKGVTYTWPPISKDLTIAAAEASVPIPLYNLMAWIVGLTDEPVIDRFVTVSNDVHLKLLSILQDVMYLQSRGKRATPKSYCLGLAVRHLTGSSKLIGLLNKLGHCVSQSTALALDTALAQMQLNRGATGIPENILQRQESILVWDNIDFSEETLSGHGTTHHTNGIIIQQHDIQDTAGNQPEKQPLPKKQRTLKVVPPFLLRFQRGKRKSPQIPIHDIQSLESAGMILRPGFVLDKAYCFMKTFGTRPSELPTWTGFNTLLHRGEPLVKSQIGYLPVIEASPTEMDTVYTLLRRSIEIADKLHLDEIIVVFDLAIYSKAQEIRWQNPDFTNRLVIRLGEFHTTMSFLTILGKRFEDAGLYDIFVESGLVAQGSVNAVLNGKHYNRSIRAHKVMFEALERLRIQAFLDSLPTEKQPIVLRFIDHLVNTFPSRLFDENIGSPEMSDITAAYDEFILVGGTENKTFALWSSYVDMVSLLLQFIRATRTSNWSLHLNCIRAMMPWFHAYDRTHYARHLPVYWLEMTNIEDTHPAVFAQVTVGKWTAQRQARYGFSSVACDQAIEQTCNRDSKTSGGITGFTLKPTAVQRWFLSQPERSAITRQCEIMAGMYSENTGRKDLECAFTQRHEQDVLKVMDTIRQMVNPFDCTQSDMINISTGVVASESCVTDLLNARDIGEKSTTEFIASRLMSTSEDFFATIKQKRLKTFTVRQTTKKKTPTHQLTSDRFFFARLLIIAKHRNVDLRKVLTYSLGAVSFPLASADGTIAKTNKALLLHCLESKCNSEFSNTLESSVLILDGMSILHGIPLRSLPATFGDLSEYVLTIIASRASRHNHKRVDVVFDSYPSRSIKQSEHDKRSSNCCLRVQILGQEQKLPKQWKNYLSNGRNKEELIEYFIKSWSILQNPALIKNLNMFLSHGGQCHRLYECDGKVIVTEVPELFSDHEEADTKISLHCMHASESAQTAIVSSPDTDVVIILLANASRFKADIIVETGARPKTRLINITKLARGLGQRFCNALPGLHAFTGCDTVSCFHGKGKKKPVEMVLHDASYQIAFTDLGANFGVSDKTVSTLQKFVCRLYGQKDEQDVNEARYKLFCTKSLCERTLPPTSDSLRQHIMRANYQACIWCHAAEQYIYPPDPIQHGWHESEGQLNITWMLKEPAPSDVLDVVACKCQRSKCEGSKCSCRSNNISCTELCTCCDCSNCALTSTETFLQENEESDSDYDDDF